MVSLVERIARRFQLPEAAVDNSWQYFGVPPETYAPEEYGHYLAKSNGVYVCSNRRAEYCSSVPLKLHKVTKTGRTDVETGDLRALLDKVNPYWTFHRLIEMTELSLCLWGSSYWALNRGASGTGPPREIWWLRPDLVTVYPGDRYVNAFSYRAPKSDQELPFKPSEIFWLRKPNPIDEFSGLSPLAAARLAADTASAAMKSNYSMFSQGMQLAGIISPKTGQPMLSDDQGKLLEQQFKKFRGGENAHKWAIMKTGMDFNSFQISNKDAEFLGMMEWSLEEIARAYGIPLDLIGGQRTYANVEASERLVWSNTIVPELRMIATELTEQMLPMFPGQADLAEFDVSKVSALQESVNDVHTRARENFKLGGMTVNRFMEIIGEEPLPDAQGNVLMIPSTVVFIKPEDLTAKADMAMAPPPDPNALTEPGEDKPKELPPPKGAKALPATTSTRSVEFGSAEHERLWRAFTQRSDKHERKVAKTTTLLMQNQQKHVLANLRAERKWGARDVAEAADNPFDKATWVRRFREAIRPVFISIVDDIGSAAMDQLGVGIAFDVKSPQAIRFLEQRAQRFAVQVNQTTWDALKASLSEGVDAGESIDELAKRVESVMGDRIRSSGETIARTEVTGMMSGGDDLAWEQSGVVAGSEWLSALDERTRETHVDAHGQRRRLGEDFDVGAGSGPGPGQIGLAEEDCNCRCTRVAVLDVDWEDE